MFFLYLPFIITRLGKRVCWCVVLPQDMKNFEVIVLQLFVPSGHPSCQFLWRLPVGEVFVVSLNDKQLLGLDEVGSPVFNRF